MHALIRLCPPLAPMASRAARHALALACVAGIVVHPGHAQPRLPSPADIEQRRTEQETRRKQLSEIEQRLSDNAAARARLEEEVNRLRQDRAQLNASLIETTRKAQALEARISATEGRLTLLTDSEAAIRRSLDARRGLIADVLAALQRMGRKPPPAVLVQPEDMLSAVRAAILMGAVLPELREEVETLALDLQEQARLRERIAADRKALGDEFEGLALERQRLAALVEARREREAAAGRDIAAEQKQAEALAEQARSLREFVARIETELATATRLAEEARRALESQAREARERMAALAFRDPARLQPRISFAEARGLLPCRFRAVSCADSARAMAQTQRAASQSPHNPGQSSPHQRMPGWPMPALIEVSGNS